MYFIQGGVRPETLATSLSCKARDWVYVASGEMYLHTKGLESRIPPLTPFSRFSKGEGAAYPYKLEEIYF